MKRVWKQFWLVFESTKCQMRLLHMTKSAKICNAIPHNVKVVKTRYIFSDGDRQLSDSPIDLNRHEILKIPAFPSTNEDYVIEVKVGICRLPVCNPIC